MNFLTNSQILNIIRLAGDQIEKEFNSECLVEDETTGIRGIDPLKVEKLFKKYKLPTTPDQLEAAKEFNFKLQNHPNLKTKYNKGDHVVIMIGHVMSTGDFIESPDRTLIIKVKESIEFERNVDLNSGNEDSIERALGYYLKNDLIEIINVTGNMVFNVGVCIPSTEE